MKTEIQRKCEKTGILVIFTYLNPVRLK